MPRTDQVAVEVVRRTDQVAVEVVRRLTDAVRGTEDRILLRLVDVDALLGDVMAMVGARPSRDIGGTATVNGEGTVAELRGAGSVSVRSDVTARVTTVTVNVRAVRDEGEVCVYDATVPFVEEQAVVADADHVCGRCGKVCVTASGRGRHNRACEARVA